MCLLHGMASFWILLSLHCVSQYIQCYLLSDSFTFRAHREDEAVWQILPPFQAPWPWRRIRTPFIPLATAFKSLYLSRSHVYKAHSYNASGFFSLKKPRTSVSSAVTAAANVCSTEMSILPWCTAGLGHTCQSSWMTTFNKIKKILKNRAVAE